MADTILEALAEFSDKEYVGGSNYDELIINDETREIFIPESEKLFGVESDEKAERKHFKCPRYVGDNIDLTKLSIRINYRNANDETDQYIVMDTAVEEGNDDEIVFSWLLSRKVTKYRGAIQFIVCAVKSEDGKIKNEWNTAIATGEVLEGLEADVDVTPSEADILEQLVNMATESTSKANEALAQAEQLKQELQDLVTQAQETIERIEELEKNIFTENTPINFDSLSEPQNIVSGDNVKQIAQKTQSVFNELGEAAQYDVASSLSEITDTELQVPDARLLKQVNDKTYNDLNEKPKINNVELAGNKTLEDIGVIKAITDILNDGAKIKYQVITDISLLPEAGESGIIYLVPPDEMFVEGEPVIENKFIEYMWVDDHYESIGQVSAEQLIADAELSTTSENPVQNKVITAKVNEIESDLNSMNTVVNAQGEAITGLDNRTQSQGESLKKDVWNFKDFVQIPINANLNTYKDVGNYCCYSNNDVATLVNCPTNRAFTMRVEYANGSNSYLRQIISTYYDSETYVRNYRKDENGEIWSTWESVCFVGKIFGVEDFGSSGASYSDENLKILLHDRMKVLINTELYGATRSMTVQWRGTWNGYGYFCGEVTTIPNDLYITTCYSHKEYFIAYGNIKSSSLASFYKVGGGVRGGKQGTVIVLDPLIYEDTTSSYYNFARYVSIGIIDWVGAENLDENAIYTRSVLWPNHFYSHVTFCMAWPESGNNRWISEITAVGETLRVLIRQDKTIEAIHRVSTSVVTD